MITPDEAIKLILGAIEPLPAEEIPLEEAVGRTLAGDLFASVDLPPFRNTAMDGFALRSEDTLEASTDRPVILRIKEVAGAGHVTRKALRKEEAIRIMTGSPLPAGSDAVVMMEMTQPAGDGRAVVFQPVRIGENVRGQGEDVRAGDLLAAKGTRIRPYEVALLGAQGFATVAVIRKPRIVHISTGDELVGIAQPLGPGQIRNSNGPAISGALRRWGVPSRDLGICRDSPRELKGILARALRKADLLLISGGVSVGDFDYTRGVLEGLGMKEVFWKVAIKPGKPLLFGIFPPDSGRDRPAVPVFGLPGNPVSVLVCLEEFVRPALEKLQGYDPAHPRYHLHGRAENGYVTPEERQQYLFCQVSREGEEFRITIIRPQGSAMVGMACRANALAIAPIGKGRIEPGDTLAFRWLK